MNNTNLFRTTFVPKLKVRNMKPISVNKKYVSTLWTKLEKGVQAIQNSFSTEVCLEEMYSIVVCLCKLNFSRELYDHLCMLINSHVKNCLLPAISNEIDCLEMTNYSWVKFCHQTIKIKNVFLYLDRTFVLHSGQCLMPLSVIQHNSFKEHLILNPYVRSRIINELLYWIQLERKGIRVDGNLLKSLIEMMMTLQIYDAIFELPFLTASRLTYKTEGEVLIKKYDSVKYLIHVGRRCSEEKQRVNNYLSASTEQPLIEVLVNQLIGPHLQKILEDGIDALMKNFYLEELSMLYKLLDFLPRGRAELCMAFGDYLKRRGRLIVINPANDKNMIKKLIEFKDKIDTVISVCFKNDKKYIDVVRNSFNYFISQRHNKPAELLAKFVDVKLRCRDLGEEDIESLLVKVMVLFRFVQGKDVFEAFYKRNLAKRLLIGKSTSQDSETNMISKLKEECGSGYTLNIEGMFKDITVSREINSSFRRHLNETSANGNGFNSLKIDMFVNVLTGGYWPNYPSCVVNLPSEMLKHRDTFLKFYMGCHSGRRLHWQPGLEHCIVKADFFHGKKELHLSLFQSIVILLFNSADEVTYEDILEATNLERNELKRILQSLTCGKARILLKVPKGKEINESDSFVVNKEFTNKLFRIKINQVQMKETVEEQKATQESVTDDRHFQIDAAIVRIMKLNKTLSHNLLISELFNTLDMPIKSAVLKSRIEQLIEKDYMERDKNDKTVYKYIA